MSKGNSPFRNISGLGVHEVDSRIFAELRVARIPSRWKVLTSVDDPGLLGRFVGRIAPVDPIMLPTFFTRHEESWFMLSARMDPLLVRAITADKTGLACIVHRRLPYRYDPSAPYPFAGKTLGALLPGSDGISFYEMDALEPEKRAAVIYWGGHDLERDGVDFVLEIPSPEDLRFLSLLLCWKLPPRFYEGFRKTLPHSAGNRMCDIR